VSTRRAKGKASASKGAPAPKRAAAGGRKRKRAKAAEAPVAGPPLDDIPLDEPSPEEIAPLTTEEGVATFLEAVADGRPWYPALLDVIARWVEPEETVDGVVYRYLIAGEAFDWLRLAERLIDAAGDSVPADEAERLLFERKPPLGYDESEDAFARAIGHQKYRAHLNFQYGVTVEEALLLQAEMELQKARNLEGPRSAPPDIAAYEGVYGRSLEDLVAEYRAETGVSLPQRIGQSQLRAFTYWCSKYRFRLAEPARVASDTRKALALLSQLEAARVPRERRVPGSAPEVIEV
jgi:hypothetical protein